MVVCPDVSQDIRTSVVGKSSRIKVRNSELKVIFSFSMVFFTKQYVQERIAV